MLADCRCQKCGTIYEDKILFNGETFTCPNCNEECEILPAISATFRLKYDNKKDKVSWSGEGYATSQYYKEQKKLCKGNIFPVSKTGK
jgi:NAD-dependent SIR2 family protein deacetylase